MDDHRAAAVAELVALRGMPGDVHQLAGEASDLARYGFQPWHKRQPSPALLAVLPELATLDVAEFSRLLRFAANRGLLMRDDVGPRGVPVYRTPHPAKAIGSPLDDEEARFREAQRQRHPSDLPGQRLMFAEGPDATA